MYKEGEYCTLLPFLLKYEYCNIDWSKVADWFTLIIEWSVLDLMVGGKLAVQCLMALFI